MQGKGGIQFQYIPAVTHLFLPGFTPSITPSYKRISEIMQCHTPMVQSPPKSPTYKCMRLLGEHLDINNNTGKGQRRAMDWGVEVLERCQQGVATKLYKRF